MFDGFNCLRTVSPEHGCKFVGTVSGITLVAFCSACEVEIEVISHQNDLQFIVLTVNLCR